MLLLNWTVCLWAQEKCAASLWLPLFQRRNSLELDFVSLCKECLVSLWLLFLFVAASLSCVFLWVCPTGGLKSALRNCKFLTLANNEKSSNVSSNTFSISHTMSFTTETLMSQMLALSFLCLRSGSCLAQLLRLSKFYCSIFKLTKSLFCHLHSAMESIWWSFRGLSWWCYCSL